MASTNHSAILRRAIPLLVTPILAEMSKVGTQSEANQMPHFEFYL